MTVQLTKTEISKLERRKKIVSCVAVVCRVCGFRQHTAPSSYLSDHERCPKGCELPTHEAGHCRLCGDPVQSRHPNATCLAHSGRTYRLSDTGRFSTQVAETHWHAADGTGPVSQYAVTR